VQGKTCGAYGLRSGDWGAGFKSSLEVTQTWPKLGGVDHCSLHCCLAKIRGLMYGVKYGAVIGRETRFLVCAQYEYAGCRFLSQSQGCVWPCTSNHGISPNNSVYYSGWLNPLTKHQSVELRFWSIEQNLSVSIPARCQKKFTFRCFHGHYTRPLILGQKGVSNVVLNKKYTFYLSIPAETCAKSRLLVAVIGGSLEGVYCLVWSWDSR